MDKKSELKDECPACSTVKIELKPDAEYRVPNWPLQIKLIGTVAPFLEGADLLVAADCTAFSAPGYLKGEIGEKKLLIGCPKLDGAPMYMEKFAEIFAGNDVKKVTCLRMEVPCCGGMTVILDQAIKSSGKKIPLDEVILGIKGDMLSTRKVNY